MEMSSVRFSESAPATNEPAVARLERALAVSFPEDYRAFLLTVNGGRPDPGCLRFEFGGETDDFQVHFFFGVDDPETSCDLKWNADITRETHTAELLPIASDECGCRFYLTVRGPRVGEVLFGGLPVDGVVTYGRLAGSFGAFLELLEDGGIE
jgi:hypothetical protein